MKKVTVEEQDKIKRLYDLIIERKLQSVFAISYLEKTTGLDFKSTKDFKDKMERFFIGGAPNKGAELKELRKRKGLTLSTLATILGCSARYLKMMESNKRPINRKAVSYLRDSTCSGVE